MHFSLFCSTFLCVATVISVINVRQEYQTRGDCSMSWVPKHAVPSVATGGLAGSSHFHPEVRGGHVWIHLGYSKWGSEPVLRGLWVIYQRVCPFFFFFYSFQTIGGFQKVTFIQNVVRGAPTNAYIRRVMMKIPEDRVENHCFWICAASFQKCSPEAMNEKKNTVLLNNR